MNIVVTSPKTTDIVHKMKDPYNSFWSLKRRPKKLNAEDIVWIVKNGYIIGGFRVRKILHAKHPVKYATGHNPSDCWRIWFDSLVGDDELLYYGVLDKEGNSTIKIKGFQGFRYQWW